MGLLEPAKIDGFSSFSCKLATSFQNGITPSPFYLPSRSKFCFDLPTPLYLQLGTPTGSLRATSLKSANPLNMSKLLLLDQHTFFPLLGAQAAGWFQVSPNPTAPRRVFGDLPCQPEFDGPGDRAGALQHGPHRAGRGCPLKKVAEDQGGEEGADHQGHLGERGSQNVLDGFQGSNQQSLTSRTE